MRHDDRNNRFVHHDFQVTHSVTAEDRRSFSTPKNHRDCDHFERDRVIDTVVELEVYQAGELTVIGFGGREIIDQLNFADCYDEIMQLILNYNCQTLALDLTGIRLIPSGLLGVLMSVYRQSVDVHLFNASKDIQEVLEITKLDRLLHLHDVEV